MMQRLFLTLVFLFASAALADDTPVLPPNGFDGGWTKFSQPKVFTSSDLYGYINGGAELFLEFGFEALTVQRYKNGENEIHIELYRMIDEVAAHGVFLMKCGSAVRDSSLRIYHTINQYQLLFRRNRFFVIIANQSGNERFIASMIRAAKIICERVGGDESLALLSSLPAEFQVTHSLRLIRGPYALQSIYTLGDGNILQLTNNLTAVAADYQTENESYTMIRVLYPDSTAAERVFHFIHDKLDEHLKEITFDEQRMTFLDYANQYGVIFLDKNSLTMRLHLNKNPD